MLNESWQGRRVSVRRVVERRTDGRLLQADVVGELTSVDGVTAVVATARGQVETPLALITAARLVPPSTADELALEAVAATLLQPAHTHELDGWLLRADGGLIARANSVLPVRQLRRPLSEALAQARLWYAEREVPLTFQVPVESRRLLDAELAERGWAAAGGVDVLVAPLGRLRATDAGRVRLTAAPDDGWLALYRGGAGLGEATRALLTRPGGHGETVFASIADAGATVATGRARVNGDWVGIGALEVAPAHQRLGLASAVVTALARWGAEQAAVRAFVQVSIDNAPALGLYERLGFWRHHSYHYRLDPGD